MHYTEDTKFLQYYDQIINTLDLLEIIRDSRHIISTSDRVVIIHVI